MLLDITEKSFFYNAYNDQLKKLKGGVFVKKAIEDWNNKKADNLKQKIMIFAGHDATGRLSEQITCLLGYFLVLIT